MPLHAARAALLVAAFMAGCGGGLEPEPASTACPSGICGTVRFRGAVPDSTDYVRVVVYRTLPTTPGELILFAGFSDPLPLGVDSAFYTCCVSLLSPATYAWVLVVWKKLGTLDFATAPALLREIGSYRDPADTSLLGSVTVPSTGGAPRIDIIADFGKMRSISDFFPPAALGSPAAAPRR